MIISIGRPSTMDAKLVADKGADPGILITIKPRRYSKSQRKVTLFPFSIIREEAPGAFDKDNGMLDQGYITLDTRTGKLIIEHRNEEVPVEPEKK